MRFFALTGGLAGALPWALACVLALAVALELVWAPAFVPGMSGVALADNACDRPATDADALECATLRLRGAEREMAIYLDDLLKSEEPEVAEALKQAQAAWLQWREAEGALAAAGVKDKGLAQLARRRQEAQLTEDRVKDLKSLSGS